MKKSDLKSTRKKSSKTSHASRRKRARAIVAYLKRQYPRPKSELFYRTHFQFLVAVMLSAQCTDKAVNRVTKTLFMKYKTARDFSLARRAVFEREISSIPFFRNKTKAIIETARIIDHTSGGRVPRSSSALMELPGIGYKTAMVILGELFDIWEGIPTDTHVRRFALKFDLTDRTDLEGISKDLERLIPREDWRFVNNGLVLYGRYVCPARKHNCADHPLTRLWRPAADRWPKAS